MHKIAKVKISFALYQSLLKANCLVFLFDKTIIQKKTVPSSNTVVDI